MSLEETGARGFSLCLCVGGRTSVELLRAWLVLRVLTALQRAHPCWRRTDVRRFDDPGPAVATIAAAPPVSVTRPAAVPAVPQSTEGHLQVGGSSSSAVVLPHLNPLNGRSWPWPPSPVPHHRAGERRQRARDAFNMQELLFGDALAQRDFSDPSVEDIGQLLSDDSPALNGWGRGSFRVQLRDLQTLIRDVEGRELDNSEVAWVLRLALRKQEGPALLRPSCLRYALLARHGFQSLP
eukprot:g5043.t1